MQINIVVSGTMQGEGLGPAKAPLPPMFKKYII